MKSPAAAVSRSGQPADRRRPDVRSGASFFAHAAILVSAGIVVFLAAGPPQGSLGIFLTLAGIALIAFPPVVQVSWKLWTAAGALAGCTALALLPAAWFPTPLWRTQLASSTIVALPSTVSASPWETGFWLAVVAVSICIGLFLLSHPIRSAGMITLAAGASLACSVYAVMAIVAKLSGWKYVFSGAATFGFFPNRNHTAAFLVTGMLLAVSVLGVAYRRKHWIAGGVATASASICAATLGVFSESRGGVVFAVTGVALWILGLGRAHLDRRFVIYAGVFLLFVGAAFFSFGGVARDRIFETFHQAKRPAASADPAGDGPTLDARLLIYQDAFRMARNAPITGSGLGTFAWIFPQYEKAALSDATSIHPESDWFMLADEAGVPAVICGAVLLWLLFQSVSGRREHPYWPLRWGCMIAVAAALLHGLVDVPVHRVALGWWILALAGLAFQTERAGRSPRFGSQRVAFTLAGLLAVGLGVQLVRAEWFKGEALPPFYVRAAERRITEAYRRQAFEEAYYIAQAGRLKVPFAADLYFQEGYFRLYFPEPASEVDALFDAQRRLSPNWPGVAMEQARVWASVDVARGATLWAETLNRRQRVVDVDRSGQASVIGLYQAALGEATTQPELQKLLLRESGRGAAFALVAAQTVVPSLAGEFIDRLSADKMFLDKLTPEQRTRFISILAQRGSKESLARFQSAHPGWK